MMPFTLLIECLWSAWNCLRFEEWCILRSFIFSYWSSTAQRRFCHVHIKKLLLCCNSFETAHLREICPASFSSASTATTWASWKKHFIIYSWNLRMEAGSWWNLRSTWLCSSLPCKSLICCLIHWIITTSYAWQIWDWYSEENGDYNCQDCDYITQRFYLVQIFITQFR